MQMLTSINLDITMSKLLLLRMSPKESLLIAFVKRSLRQAFLKNVDVGGSLKLIKKKGKERRVMPPDVIAKDGHKQKGFPRSK